MEVYCKICESKKSGYEIVLQCGHQYRISEAKSCLVKIKRVDKYTNMPGCPNCEFGMTDVEICATLGVKEGEKLLKLFEDFFQQQLCFCPDSEKWMYLYLKAILTENEINAGWFLTFTQYCKHEDNCKK